MKTLRTTILVIFCALAAGFLAQTAQACGQSTARGTLWAEGEGIVEIIGSGTVTLKCDDEGVIKIDNYRGAKIDIDGKYDKMKLEGDTLLIYELDGRVSVTSSSLSVRFKDGEVEVYASVEGLVFIKGKGEYNVGRGNESWSRHGESMVLVAQVRIVEVRKVAPQKRAPKKPVLKRIKTNPPIIKKQVSKHSKITARIIEVKKQKPEKKVETKKDERKPEKNKKSDTKGPHDGRGGEKRSDDGRGHGRR